MDLEGLFREAYLRLHARVLDHAERFLDRDAAQDAVAEAMVGIWNRWPLLAPEQRNDQYFFRAVHHAVVNVIRERAEIVSLDEVDEELARQTAQAYESARGIDGAADVLDLALAAMPPRRREVFLLVREEAFTYQQAAEVLGLSIGTINTHMRLANEELRAAFTRAGYRIANLQPARLPAPKGDVAND